MAVRKPARVLPEPVGSQAIPAQRDRRGQCSGAPAVAHDRTRSDRAGNRGPPRPRPLAAHFLRRVGRPPAEARDPQGHGCIGGRAALGSQSGVLALGAGEGVIEPAVRGQGVLVIARIVITHPGKQKLQARVLLGYRRSAAGRRPPARQGCRDPDAGSGGQPTAVRPWSICRTPRCP